MHINFLFDLFLKHKSEEAIIWKNKSHSYGQLLNNIKRCQSYIKSTEINSGTVVALEGDFSPISISLLLTLIDRECIVVPLTKNSNQKKSYFEIAQVEFIIRVDERDNYKLTSHLKNQTNALYDQIRKKHHPGLVLFTSGTSGVPKAAVHDFVSLLEKFKLKHRALRTLNFLLFDHWGGLNTMFHILSSGGVVIATKSRVPENICKMIEVHKIELLPASPTFLNLLLISSAYKNFNLNSLKLISYGTEPMPENTLKKLKLIFPNVKLLQTYGLIELGVMKTKSEKDDSLWVKVGGDNYQTRIVDGLLEIKAKSAMLGYLNSPSPFTKDGWFKTGDSVEQKGEYIRILGRKSELINVGGEKVYPQEIESVINQFDNVAEVVVFGQKNPFLGNIVCAKIKLYKEEDIKKFSIRLKKFCSKKMKKYMIPVKISITDENLHNVRFKKIRKLKK